MGVVKGTGRGLEEGCFGAGGVKLEKGRRRNFVLREDSRSRGVDFFRGTFGGRSRGVEVVGVEGGIGL